MILVFKQVRILEKSEKLDEIVSLFKIHYITQCFIGLEITVWLSPLYKYLTMVLKPRGRTGLP